MKVLYEDNHIIVVQKEPNIPSQQDKTGDIDMLTLVKKYIKEKYNKPGDVYIGLVHRLDRPVGGVMVFARTSKAASRLSEQVRNKTMKKTYIAMVDGKLKEKCGILEDYLYKDERNNMSKVVDKNKKNAKLAKLEYEVIDYDEKNRKKTARLLFLQIKSSTKKRTIKHWTASVLMILFHILSIIFLILFKYFSYTVLFLKFQEIRCISNQHYFLELSCFQIFKARYLLSGTNAAPKNRFLPDRVKRAFPGTLLFLSSKNPHLLIHPQTSYNPHKNH